MSHFNYILSQNGGAYRVFHKNLTIAIIHTVDTFSAPNNILTTNTLFSRDGSVHDR